VGQTLACDQHTATVRAFELFAREVYQRRPGSALPPRQWVIIRHLKARAETGCTLAALQKSLARARDRIELVVASLRERGDVGMSEDASGQPLACLTDAGALRLLDDPVSRLDGALVRLPPRDKQRLHEMMLRLTQAMAIDAKLERRGRQAGALTLSSAARLCARDGQARLESVEKLTRGGIARGTARSRDARWARFSIDRPNREGRFS